MAPMNAPLDTRSRIVNSARELIFASSFTDVGVAAICAHAGVRKGSFYHFFPSKRDLTLAVLEQQYIDAKAQLLDRAFATDIPPLDRLRRLAQLSYEFQQQLQQQTGFILGCPFGNLATEMSTQDEILRLAIERIMKRFQQHLHDALVEAVADGTLNGIDTTATAQAMLAYFEGVMLLAKTENNPEVIARLLPGVAQIRIPKISE